jgi:hypothetical protein
MPPRSRPATLARAQHHSLSPKLTPKRLAQFERGLPHPLLEDFRKVLLEYNGALLGECAVQLPGAPGREVRIHELLGVHDEGWGRLEHGLDDIPSDVLVFAEAGPLDCFGLQLADRKDSPRGTVWFFDSEEGPRTQDTLYTARPCAPSFTAFLEQLTPLPDASVDPLPEDPRSPWKDPAALEKRPADKPTSRKPLVLAGHGHGIQRAVLSIHVSAWSQHPKTYEYRYTPGRARATYSLEIEVDERSGEDGLPAPEAQAIPVAAAHKGRHPTLAEWSSLVVGPVKGWEASYGNDAPRLTNNRLTVLGRKGTTLKVRWEATYSQFGRDFAFLFEGPVQFPGIRFNVRAPEDVDRVLASAFGGDHRPEEWTRKVGRRMDRGENEPERYLYPVTLVPRNAKTSRARRPKAKAQRPARRR